MIWADSYDRDLTDVLAIQSEIAEQVAARVNDRLRSETPEQYGEKPTNN
jgi:TolB-like protein